MQHCTPLLWYLQSSLPIAAQGRGDDASHLHHPFRGLFGPKRTDLNLLVLKVTQPETSRANGTQRRGDPSDVRFNEFSTDRSHHSLG